MRNAVKNVFGTDCTLFHIEQLYFLEIAAGQSSIQNNLFIFLYGAES